MKLRVISLLLLVALGSSTVATASTTVNVNGHAQVVNSLALGNRVKISDTGYMTGAGSREQALLNASISGVLTAKLAHASTITVGNHNRSEAVLADLRITVGENVITAKLLHARTVAVCSNGEPFVDGTALVAGLVVNGKTVLTSDKPNQKIALIGGRIILNQHYRAHTGYLTTIALRVMVDGVADIMLGRAHSSVGGATACFPASCGVAGCTDKGDFATGSGLINVSASAKVTFGLTAGLKGSSPWGHLVFVDEQAGIQVKASSIIKYTVLSSVARRIEGYATVNGQANVKFVLDLTDNGEPGTDDVLNLSLATGYKLQAKLHIGNMQIVRCD